MAKFYTPTRLSENIHETPEGYLLCLGVPIARTGWQVYGMGETPLEVGPDGTIKIYRDAKEVFRAETIASFQAKSVTVKHPNDFVDPINWQSLTRGVAQNIRKAAEKDPDGEESLLADLLITEALAIGLVKNGLREVSCGYEAEYEQTGEGEGRQYNIIGNHIALVEEGRAGSSYAINDHKGKVTMKQTLLEKLTKRFGAKVIDEVMNEEKKESKDEKEAGSEKEAKDASSYDELVKMVKDLGAKIEGMGKPAAKDEEKPEPKKEEKPAKDADKEEEKAEDDDGEEMKIEERIKALEAAVAKLLESKTGDEEGEEGEESESAEDSEEESEDDDFEESSLTGDTAARVEILAPGLKASGKKDDDIKQRALMAAFGTKDGREAIEAVTGSKKLTLDSAQRIDTLFVAVSEVLKAKRGNGLEKTKDAKSFQSFDNKAEEMTADKMNELNAAHWARK